LIGARRLSDMVDYGSGGVNARRPAVNSDVDVGHLPRVQLQKLQQRPRGSGTSCAFDRHVLKPGLVFKGEGLKPPGHQAPSSCGSGGVNVRRGPHHALYHRLESPHFDFDLCSDMTQGCTHSRVSDWSHGPYRLSRGPYRLSRGPYEVSPSGVFDHMPY
jgi:hypothetical protein